MLESFTRSLISVALTVLACAAPATADIISINFSPSGPDPTGVATDLSQTTFPIASVVGVAPAANWNTVLTTGDGNVSRSAGALVDDAGGVTSLSFATGGAFLGATGYDYSDTDTVATDTARLLNGQIGVTNGEGTLTASGISYSVYDVIVYFAPNAPDRTTRLGITSAGYLGPQNFFSYGGILQPSTGTRDAFVLATGTTDATATSGANYALFSGLTSSSFTIGIEDGGTGDPNNSIYGFQIVSARAVPEPASFAMLGGGGLGLLIWARRRKGKTTANRA